MPEITVTKTTKVVGGLGKANKAQKKLGLNVGLCCSLLE